MRYSTICADIPLCCDCTGEYEYYTILFIFGMFVFPIMCYHFSKVQYHYNAYILFGVKAFQRGEWLQALYDVCYLLAEVIMMTSIAVLLYNRMLCNKCLMMELIIEKRVQLMTTITK